MPRPFGRRTFSLLARRLEDIRRGMTWLRVEQQAASSDVLFIFTGGTGLADAGRCSDKSRGTLRQLLLAPGKAFLKPLHPLLAFGRVQDNFFYREQEVWELLADLR